LLNQKFYVTSFYDGSVLSSHIGSIVLNTTTPSLDSQTALIGIPPIWKRDIEWWDV